MQLAGMNPHVGRRRGRGRGGGGYYTVRLARIVGPKGRVLAEDIVPDTRDRSERPGPAREIWDNVAVKLGTADNPMLAPRRRSTPPPGLWFTCTMKWLRPTPSCGTSGTE
jgi:hypothetical protein